MIKLVVKIILLLILQVCFVQSFWANVPLKSPIWGDEVGNLKYDYYYNNTEQYGAVFIGSSRFFRHISPGVFNSLQIDKRSKSYNWGAPAFYGHKTLFLLKDVLGRNKLPKYIFVEFDFGDTPNVKNLHHCRTFYPYDFYVWKTLIKSIQCSDIDLLSKWSSFKIHCINFSDNLFKVGQGFDLIRGIFFNSPIGESVPLRLLGRMKDGYYPLDQHFADQPKDETMRRRSTQVYDHPRKLIDVKQESQMGFRAGNAKKPNNEIFFELFSSLIEQARLKGVKIIFVLSPRRGVQYEFLLPVFNRLPSGNKIELADPDKYPEFYSPENSFDVGHLNHKGAMLFTERLTQEFMALESLADHEQ